MACRKPLLFKVEAKCSTSRARAAILRLGAAVCRDGVSDEDADVESPNRTPINTPVFMPVGTQGAMKGVTPTQLIQDIDCRIMLSNTYHLGLRPGIDVLSAMGGLHNFMRWPRSLLTDSGGFQMVSLAKLSSVNEEGVTFTSPFLEGADEAAAAVKQICSKVGLKHKSPAADIPTDQPSIKRIRCQDDSGIKGCKTIRTHLQNTADNDSAMLLTPEHSIRIQEAIGADIIMQLDDVVDVTHTDGNRFVEASDRTVRWLDRCLTAHKKSDSQSVFPIVQGGLNEELRRSCATQLIQRETRGFAIGGLSGGEAKEDFWRMVSASTELLPENKPRYLMGVGHTVDLVVCSALGVDMFDCVHPTRTARFGTALLPVWPKQLNLRRKQFAADVSVIQEGCQCSTCRGGLTRAYIHSVLAAGRESTAASLISVHNLHSHITFMLKMHNAIRDDTFPHFVANFFRQYFHSEEEYPAWAVRALLSVGIHLR